MSLVLVALAALALPFLWAVVADASLRSETVGDLGARAATLASTAVTAGISAAIGARWSGPDLVAAPGAPTSLAIGAAIGALCLGAGVEACRRFALPPLRGVSEDASGLGAGLSMGLFLILGVALVARHTDLKPHEATQHQLEDEARASFTSRLETRAWVDPWDPDVWLARAFLSVYDDHAERALTDAERAERLGGDPAALASVRAEALASLGRCDEARSEVDRWHRARATAAMEEHFGEEFERLMGDDPLRPTVFFFHCSGDDYYGE